MQRKQKVLVNVDKVAEEDVLTCTHTLMRYCRVQPQKRVPANEPHDANRHINRLPKVLLFCIVDYFSSKYETVSFTTSTCGKQC